MTPQPASFQIISKVIRNLNRPGSVMRSKPSWPFSRSVWAMSPAPPNICWNTVTTRTQEKKWGR